MAKSLKHSEATSECFFKDLGLSDDRRRVGQNRNISGALNGHRQHTLVLGTIPGNPARRNFTPFSGEIPENLYVFIINGKAAVRTELAHFSSMVSLSEPASVSVRAAVFVKGSIISHLFHPHLPRLFPLNFQTLQLSQLGLSQQIQLLLDRVPASVFQDRRYHSI